MREYVEEALSKFGERIGHSGATPARRTLFTMWLDAKDTPPIRATTLDDKDKDKSLETTFPVFYLPSDDPSIVELQPC
jgi:hypothetical protein